MNVPDDLKTLYQIASVTGENIAFTPKRLLSLIERIAELEAESAERERKGKDLCQAYGTSLITIAELKKQLARLSAPVTEAEWDEMQVKIRRDYPLGAIVDALIAARKGAAS